MNQSEIKSWLKENWFKLGILSSILLVSGAIYAALVIEPQRREASAEFKASLEKAVQSAKETERQSNIDSCLASAMSSYSDQWYRECKSEGKLTNKCIDIHDLTFKDYLSKYGITEEEYRQERGLKSTSTLEAIFDYIGRQDDECSCRLMLTQADRLNQTLKDGQDACYKRY